ncbi:Uncharacterised protein [Mycobacterium tuberculosis]|nr:Uncharacterised protein [Mycobacterium tuberculosis]SGO17185.1 Uncharacterised protein [Mycobacterium tuberculosis]
MVVVKPHGAQRVPLATAGGDENLHAPLASQLHSRHAHTAGTGMDQHRFARLDLG